MLDPAIKHHPVAENPGHILDEFGVFEGTGQLLGKQAKQAGFCPLYGEER